MFFYVLDKINNKYDNVGSLSFTLDNCDCNKIKKYEEKLICKINKILANKEKRENLIDRIKFKWNDVSVDSLVQKDSKFNGVAIEDDIDVGKFCFSTETNKFAFSYKNYKDCLKYHKNNYYSNLNDMKINLYSDFIDEILNKYEI